MIFFVGFLGGWGLILGIPGPPGGELISGKRARAKKRRSAGALGRRTFEKAPKHLLFVGYFHQRQARTGGLRVRPRFLVFRGVAGLPRIPTRK